jgi:hypothetical protein
MKPFIAKDTKKPLVVLGGYRIGEGGGVIRETVDTSKPGDYGADPLGDGKFKMVPSGDIVDLAERNKRLNK